VSRKKGYLGRIRLFGFSPYSTMEECMLGAAKLGWIDGIIVTCNYRIMNRDGMRRARGIRSRFPSRINAFSRDTRS